MKTARFLLACVAASLLAACSPDGITAPAAPARPQYDEDVAPSVDDGGTITEMSAAGTVDCILKIVVNPDGSITTMCQVNASGQFGTGN